MKNITSATKFLSVLVLLAGFVIPFVSFAQYQFYYPLQVSCRPNTASAVANTAVSWSASGVGGNGIYTYSWTGTDGLTGTTNPVSQNYTTEGTKTASITVRSGDGQTATANCGNVYVYNSNYYYGSYGNLSGSCSANVSNGQAQLGTTINWSAYAVGGNGIYTYSWSDNDGYTGIGQYLSRFYTIPGSKNMTLTINSGGQTITRNCYVYVMPSTTVNNTPTYTYSNPTYPIQNQVLAYNDPNPTLASVYLSDVPYTGLKDVLTILSFMSALVLWSAFLSYRFTKESAA